MKENSNSAGSDQSFKENAENQRERELLKEKHDSNSSLQQITLNNSSPKKAGPHTHFYCRPSTCSPGGGRMKESTIASSRDYITHMSMRMLVSIKIRKGLLHSPDSPYSTIHPPRRPAATHRSIAGLQSVSPEVAGL